MADPDVLLASVLVDVPSPGQVIPIGDSPIGPEDPCAGSGIGVCSAVCLSLADLRVTRRVKVTVTVDTHLPASEELLIAGRSIGSPVLCSVPETLMTPVSKHPTRREATVLLDACDLIDAGVDHHSVSWEWTWRTGSRKATEPARSFHPVFVVLDRPTAPWSGCLVPGQLESHPWPAALALACSWARGAMARADAAARIVNQIFRLGEETLGYPPKLEYDGDSSKYVLFLGQPHLFAAVPFLRDFGRDPTVRISCIEAAAVVSTFANLLGCALKRATIDGSCCGNLVTNCLLPLGATDPICDVTIARHHVAVRPQKTLPDLQVYDAVYRIDADAYPDIAGPNWQRPIAVALGDNASKAGHGVYLPQLLSQATLPETAVEIIPPPVVVFTEQTIMLPCDKARYLRYLAMIPEFGGKDHAGPTRFQIPGYEASVPLMPEPAIPRVGLPRIPPLHTTRYLPTDGNQDRTLAARVWADSDSFVTRSALAELLAMADVPPMPAQSQLGPTYVSKNGRTAFVLMQGAAATLSSVGREPVDVRLLLPVVTPDPG